MDRLRRPLKTYSHLAGAKRMPSEYDLVSSGLLYHVERGLEVNTPIAAWNDAHQKRGRLVCPQWDDFRDPRSTTYAKYVALHDRSECQVDGFLHAMDADGYERALTPSSVARLATVAVLRHPFHGLQMVAAYFGHMAPSGKITIAAAFQAADEMRRIQRIAYRIAQRRQFEPSFAADSRLVFERATELQPLRRLIERLLVTYDWDESFVATNVAVKPVLDELFMTIVGELAMEDGDPTFACVLDSLNEDCRWHRAYTASLLGMVREADPANCDVIDTWVARFLPGAIDAARTIMPSLAGPSRAEELLDGRLLPRVAAHLSAMGVSMPAGTKVVP